MSQGSGEGTGAEGRITGELVEISDDLRDVAEELEELVDLELEAKEGRSPKRARRYRIKIDRAYYEVTEPRMTGRQLLIKATKLPPEQYRIDQKFRDGHTQQVALNDFADFATPGVERFQTLALDSTEG